MEVVITATADDAARVVADVVVRLVTERPAAVLGLATGTSPLGAYRLLVEEHRAGRVSFAACHAVLLDEYVGLPPDHPEAYRAVIRRDFTDHVDLTPDRLHGPDVGADDLPAACARYEDLLAELGGVDLQLLGIGTDGHVGFNEPGSSLRSRTRVKTLTTATRTDNARFFASPEDVPRHVVTQGLGTITDARHVLLVATGDVEGRAGRPSDRGAAGGGVPGVGAAAPPPRHGRARRGGGRRPAARRLLPRGLRRQAAVAAVMTAPLRLDAVYVPAEDGPGVMRLRLVNSGRAPLAEFRLALTSVVQLTPDPGAPTRLVTRTSGYHELAPPAEFELPPGDVWDLGVLACGHRPEHANDGPASVFVILADGSTRPVHVGATALADPVRVGRSAPPPLRLGEVGDVAALAWATAAACERRLFPGDAAVLGDTGAPVEAAVDQTGPTEAYVIVRRAEGFEVTAGSDEALRMAFLALARHQRER